jgi:sodium/potassium/calcium exchanger 6
MAGLALAASVAWLDVAADELVALVEAAGRAWNVRRDVLGATALAWGETVPDLVAVVSLARGGQGTMAVAACFGGPVFNLLVSMGAPILFAGVAHGPMPFVMTSGVVALVVATVAILVALLATVPARLGWRLPPVLAAAVLAGWAAAQAAFLLAEGRAL